MGRAPRPRDAEGEGPRDLWGILKRLRRTLFFAVIAYALSNIAARACPLASVPPSRPAQKSQTGPPLQPTQAAPPSSLGLKASSATTSPSVNTVAESTDAAKTEASISGTVRDPDGALVPGARVKLTSRGTAGERTTVTDSEGGFHFDAVPPGQFALTIAASGLRSDSISGVLSAGEVYNAQPIILPMATASDSIEVTLPRQEVAEAQVKDEEQQRVIGIVPNYFVTYSRNPAPLDANQKFALGWHVVLDPTNFLFSGVAAGIEQANDSFPGYGRGAQGYGKRYGAALADSSVSTLLRGAVFPSLLHQDPRYFYKGTGSVTARSLYALGTAVFCKGDNGRWQPNYSSFLGALSSGALANTYYPASSRNGAALTFENALVGLAGVGVGHLMQEFLFRRLTHSASASGAANP